MQSASNASARQAIIVGGGIGGLTTALALHQHGWQVQVLEQAATISEVGAGLQISPNGCHILRKLQLLDDVLANGFLPEAIEMRAGLSGKLLIRSPLKNLTEQRWGAPYIHIHRADLINELHKHATQRGINIRNHAQVVSYTKQSDSVTVDLANGENLNADLLIGADGIHSVIQQQMLGNDPARFTGNVAWRMVVDTDSLAEVAPPPTACVWIGHQRHAVTYRLRQGKLTNLVAVVEHNAWQKESWTEQGSREQALADFDGWHPTIRRIIESASEHFRWALYDREPLTNWVDGRIALLGDACHPMLPFLAQGAVMAVEDAWVLADALNQTNDIPLALNQYQQQRKPRTADVQRAARANMKKFHQSPTLQLLSFPALSVGGKLFPNAMHKQLDWLYGHNVTL